MTTKKKNYQYQGNFGFNITKFGGGDEQCQITSKKDNSGTKSTSTTSRKFGKKSNFNRKQNGFNGDGRNPRGCSNVCPMCKRPWNVRESQKSDEPISADEFVCRNFEATIFKFFCFAVDWNV